MFIGKKSISILIAASLLALSACSSNSSSPESSEPVSSSSSTGNTDPLGKYDQPVTLNIGMGIDPNFKSDKGDTPDNNSWTKAIKENLNIDIKIAWQVANANYPQKVNLAIASNDLPDSFIVDQTQLIQMAKAGQLADLTDVYNKYASPAMKKIIDSTKGVSKKMATFNGKMLGIPSVGAEDMSMMWIRKDWLDNLGLQPPKTMDELEKVAKAFVEQDPDGDGQANTIGITGPDTNGRLYDDFGGGPGVFNFNPIFSAYKAYPGFWLAGADGKPVYGSTLPETKAALSKLRDLYAKGLIDQEMGVRKDATQPIVSGKSGIFFLAFFGGYWPLPDALKNDPNANWQAYALPLDADGKFNAKMFNPSGNFLVVRKGYKYPEAAIKVNNLILRDEQKLGIDYQPLRNIYAPRDEISLTVKAINEVLAGTKKPEDFAGMTEYKLLANDIATVKNAKKPPYDNTDIGTFNIGDKDFNRIYSLLVGGRNLLDPNLVRVNSLTYARTKTIERKWANLNKLESEAFLKIVMGAAPLESFEQFVADWKKQGGDEILAEVAEIIKQ